MSAMVKNSMAFLVAVVAFCGCVIDEAPQRTEAVLAANTRDIACEGRYDGHLQGVAADENAIYWSFTRTIVKTDFAGKLLAKTRGPSHQGDLCVKDGTVYVAVNLGKFNFETQGVSKVMAYRSSNLAKCGEWDLPEMRHGAGGMTWMGDRFFVIGGLPATHERNYVYEYDRDFRFVKRHDLETGFTLMGIQTAHYEDGRFYFGIYGGKGDPAGVLECPADLASYRRWNGGGNMGIVKIGGRWWVGRGRHDAKGNSGGLRVVDGFPQSGGEYAPERTGKGEVRFYRDGDAGWVESGYELIEVGYNPLFNPKVPGVYLGKSAALFTNVVKAVTIGEGRTYSIPDLVRGVRRVAVTDEVIAFHIAADADPAAVKAVRDEAEKLGVDFIPEVRPGGPAEDPDRPQLRYTQKAGWANDPNGLGWFHGEWHLFHQHNPYGVKWGNMHWNHAVSKDLVHWTELGDVLRPDGIGSMFSGSAVVDADNTAGFGRGAQVLVYTAAQKKDCQCLAYSLDGRTYAKYDGNPVIPAFARGNRDPKVFWHRPSRKWVMALYAEDRKCHSVVIFNSSDLKKWERTSVYHGGKIKENDRWLFECPGLEELKIEGEDKTAWVVWGAGDEYAVGDFDGRTFRPFEERLPGSAYSGWGKSPYYAAQAFNGVPDGRALWIAWFRLPRRDGAAYTHTFSLPQELSLRRTEKGLRLVRRPARELASLRTGPATVPEENKAELVELELSCAMKPAGRLELDVRGIPLVYDAGRERLSFAGTEVDWKLRDGRLGLSLYLDRLCAEVFSDDGLQMAPFATAVPDAGKRAISVKDQTGCSDVKCRVFPLKSVFAPGASR